MTTRHTAGTERTAADADAGAEIAPGYPQVPAQVPAQAATQAPAAPADARQLEAEIERTREQLGETVQELAARADVKSRARAKAAHVSRRLKDTTVQVRSNAADRVRTVRSQVAGTTGSRERWIPLAVAATVLSMGYLALSQWRRRHSASRCSR